MLQGGEDGLMRGLYLRGFLGGLTHCVFTACSGAAIGWWASQKSRSGKAFAVLVAALVLTIAQHGLWNAVAAPMIAQALCGASIDGGPCMATPTAFALFGAASLIAAGFLAPGAALVAFAWRRSPLA
jgi:hypothetical protein